MRAVALTCCLALLAPIVTSAVADDTVSDKARAAGRQAAQAGRDIGEAGKQVGHEIGTAGKQVGHDVGEAAKNAFAAGKEAGAPLLAEVRETTRKFWRQLVAERDEALEQLRRENAKLKRELAERERK